MKSWKKRWQDELDSIIPALREDVLNEPIPQREYVREAVTEREPWYAQFLASPRRLATCLAACALGLFAIGGSAYLLTPKAPLTASAEVISVEINPQALFTVDEKGMVTSVVAANEDADILLSGNRYLQMEGQTVEKAVEMFVDYAAELGYLDLNTPDGIRITSCVQDGWLDDVGDTLETYFRGKGAYIAVAEEIVEMQAFCQRANVALSETVEKLKESLERVPALVFEREAIGKTVEQLQDIYAQKVPVNELKDSVTNAVSAGITRMQRFERMEELLVLIEEHEDNPGASVFTKGYWSLKDKEVAIPDTMSALMTEMDECILTYAADYGMEIKDDLDFFAERLNIAPVDVTKLTGFLADIASGIISGQIGVISAMLEVIGIEIDTSISEELMELPQTLAAYVAKIGQYAKNCFDSLKEEARAAYETVRAAISEADYGAYIDGLIAEHGSLSEYFNKL